MKQYFFTMIMMFAFCLTVLSAQADNSTDKKLKAYPNPIDRGALLTIEIPDNSGEVTVSLYNTVGKVIQTFKTFSKRVEINVPDVSGIYLLRYVDQQKVVAVEKIVVKD